MQVRVRKECYYEIMFKLKAPRIALDKNQWGVLSSASSNMGQAMTLFGLAGFFVPQAVNLPVDFSQNLALVSFITGLSLLVVAVILSKRR